MSKKIISSFLAVFAFSTFSLSNTANATNHELPHRQQVIERLTDEQRASIQKLTAEEKAELKKLTAEFREKVKPLYNDFIEVSAEYKKFANTSITPEGALVELELNVMRQTLSNQVKNFKNILTAEFNIPIK